MEDLDVGCSITIAVSLSFFTQGDPLFAQYDFVQIGLIRADASKACKRLPRLLHRHGEVEVFALAECNTIFIRADAPTTQKAKDIIKRLDARVGLFKIKLMHTDGAAMESRLNAILKVIAWWEDDLDEIDFVNSESGKNLHFFATYRRFHQIQFLVNCLDFPLEMH